MVRNASRPNRFSQEIKDLQPGRLYVLNMFSGDRKDMSKKERHAVRIQIENATVIPGKSYTYVHTNAGGSRAYPPYAQQGSAWLNYHYKVFRAHGNTLTPMLIAGLAAALGDHERALAEIERGLEVGDPSLPFIYSDPWYDPLRDEPRFRRVLETIGLGD